MLVNTNVSKQKKNKKQSSSYAYYLLILHLVGLFKDNYLKIKIKTKYKIMELIARLNIGNIEKKF